MYVPDRQTFERLARRGQLVPVRRTLVADSLTPVTAFRRIARGGYGFLLESVERGERIGRYSFAGAAPDAVFCGMATDPVGFEVTGDPTVRDASDVAATVCCSRQDPLAGLDNYLKRFQSVFVEGLPPFAGGAVGYFGYDTVRAIERLPKPPPRRLMVPDIQFMVYRTMVVFDHVKNLLHVIHHADPASGRPDAVYESAAAEIEAVIERLRKPVEAYLDDFGGPAPSKGIQASSNQTREEFMGRVAKAKEYIAAGDIIQAVLSQRLTCPCATPPFEIYRALRAVNPSPYMFYLHLNDLHLIGSSPEVMVRLEGGRILVRPIAGTRPRGSTPEEDERLGRELLADPKERAEHAMLLDLGRNDVGRVSEPGSVRIDEQMILEHYSHVMHIVSTVTGRMRGDIGPFDVLRSCIPAGTVSGAPKIRAMEIIDELEPEMRGPYAGAVGIMDFAGNLNTAITIRTVMVQNGQAHIQVGAGIVADSDPAREYDETMNKARGMLKALELASTFRGSSSPAAAQRP